PRSDEQWAEMAALVEELSEFRHDATAPAGAGLIRVAEQLIEWRRGEQARTIPTKRTCVFCGRGPLSIEHAWPAWLQKELRTPGSIVSMRWGSGEPLTRVDKKGLEVKVGRVRIQCNTTWMSGLEDAAKPVLLPLIRGRVMPLSDTDKLLVANWALKGAMMLQFT